MAGITATFNGSTDSPGFDIVLSGLLAYDSFQVVRQDTSGDANTYPDTPVRGADSLDVVSDIYPVTDYESPLGTLVNYRLKLYTAGVLSATVDSGSTSITLANLGSQTSGKWFWIKNVPNPSLSRNVVISDFSEAGYRPTILGEYKVLGRRNPVVFTDVWGAKQGDFSVLAAKISGTYTTDPVVLEGLLTTGDVLLFQSAINNHQIRDMYFVVNNLGRTQYDRPYYGRSNDYTFDVAYQEVDQPSTAGLNAGYGIWEDLRDDPDYATYADVTADNASWLALLNRYSV